ncbi:molybdate ABC transporter substrate-binding protein [Vibrio hepatarius]|uniref:molybdate ABC transporter substrate-binding protein n=1 Tax=Vibrio hepatarius TaxID=171383 RepID=UPI00373507E2
MKITKFRHIIGTAALLFCASLSAQEQLRIYAASSMTNAVNELVDVYESNNKVKVTTVYGGTSSLARQVEQGAPVDVFIAANTKWMNYLVDKDLISGDNVTNIATNKLVVIAATAIELDVTNENSWKSALNGQRLAIGQTNAVPAGIYAKQSLESLNVWSQLKRQLAPTKNVRIALTLVERKETPLGIVYQTDALSSPNVQVVASLPETSHDAIIYPMAIMNSEPTTVDFTQFVHSKAGKEILKKYGFNQGTQ